MPVYSVLECTGIFSLDGGLLACLQNLQLVSLLQCFVSCILILCVDQQEISRSLVVISSTSMPAIAREFSARAATPRLVTISSPNRFSLNNPR